MRINNRLFFFFALPLNRFILLTVVLIFFLPVSGTSFCPACPGAGAALSGTDINTLGYGWLIPDEQSDIIHNPAYLTHVRGQRLFFSPFAEMEINEALNTEENLLGGRLFIVMPSYYFNYALRFFPVINKTLTNSDPAKEKNYTDTFSFSFSAGMPRGYTLHLGLSAGLNTEYSLSSVKYEDPVHSDSYFSEASTELTLKAGAVFDISKQLNFGIAAEGLIGAAERKNNFILSESGDTIGFNLSLLPEIKLNKNLAARARLGMSYKSTLASFYKNSVFLRENESLYLFDISAGAGITYFSPDNYTAGLALKTRILPEKTERFFYGTSEYTDTISGFYTDAVLFIKKDFFSGRMILSLLYEFFNLKNETYENFTLQNGNPASSGSRNFYSAEVFPEVPRSIMLGAGIYPDENILVFLELSGTSLSAENLSVAEKFSLKLSGDIIFIFE